MHLAASSADVQPRSSTPGPGRLHARRQLGEDAQAALHSLVCTPWKQLEFCWCRRCPAHRANGPQHADFLPGLLQLPWCVGSRDVPLPASCLSGTQLH